MLKDISDYGTINTAGGDWTAAIQAMANDGHGNGVGVGGDRGHVVLPPGKGVYNGTPLALANLNIEGRSPWHTMLTCTTPLVNTTGVGVINIENLALFGGTNPIQIGTATDVGGRMRRIHDVEFHGYSGAAILITGSDTPYFDIQRCTFDGAANSTGISIAGFSDSTVISHNEFRSYKIGIKFGGAMQRTTVENNNFMHVSETSSAPRYDVWLVPSTSNIANNGQGVTFSKNWHSNEGRATNDWFYVFADASSGLPNLAAESTGYIYGVQISDELAVYPAAAQPYIFAALDETHMKFNSFGFNCRRYVPAEAYAAGPMLQTLSTVAPDNTNRVYKFLDLYNTGGGTITLTDPLPTDFADGLSEGDPHGEVPADWFNTVSDAINTLAGA